MRRAVAMVKPACERAFRANKKWVSYAGRRWRLVQDRGAYVLLERRGVSQWAPRAVVK